VDGPAGSGETTLAAGSRPGRRGGRRGRPVRGLARAGQRGRPAPRPVATAGQRLLRDLPRWDWPGNAWAETVLVRPLLVVEGVGSGSAARSDLVLAWVEVPPGRMVRPATAPGSPTTGGSGRDEQALFERSARGSARTSWSTGGSARAGDQSKASSTPLTAPRPEECRRHTTSGQVGTRRRRSR
jgi:hypothetical protein